MRIGILSDTHDRLERTQGAVDLLREQGAQALIHCGDLTGPDIVFACGVLPAFFVFGNNDVDNVHEIRQAIQECHGVCLEWAGEVVLADKRIAVTHGHVHSDIRRLLNARPDYLLTGHTHVAHDRQDSANKLFPNSASQTRRINPGALHRAEEYSVALLDLVNDALHFLKV